MDTIDVFLHDSAQQLEQMRQKLEQTRDEEAIQKETFARLGRMRREEYERLEAEYNRLLALQEE